MKIVILIIMMIIFFVLVFSNCFLFCFKIQNSKFKFKNYISKQVYFFNFSDSHNKANANIKVFATFCELYNEDLFDLFFTENTTTSLQNNNNNNNNNFNSIFNNSNVNNLSKNSMHMGHNQFLNTETRMPLLSNIKLANNETVNNGKKRVFLKEKDKYFCIPGKRQNK